MPGLPIDLVRWFSQVRQDTVQRKVEKLWGDPNEDLIHKTQDY